MNWEKAKTVLLIALLLTDIFLAGVLVYDSMRIEPAENSEEFYEEAADVLKENGILLQADIEAQPSPLAVLEVAYETDSAENWNKRFFNGEAKITENDEQFVLMEVPHAKLSVVEGRRLIYEADHTSNVSLDGDEAQEACRRFLEEKGFQTEDIEPVSMVQKGNHWRIVYTGLYKDHYLESTYAEFELLGDKIVGMERIWVDVVQETDEKKVLPPAPQALLKLLSYDGLKNRIIKEVAPCYYFNPKEQGVVENLSHAARGKATVAWRMVLDGGEELVLLH